MKLACFLTAFSDGYSSQTAGYAQLHYHQDGFIAPLSTGIWADLDVAGQYDVIGRSGLVLFLSIFTLRHSLEIDSNRYVGVEQAFLGYTVSTGKLHNLLPLRMDKRISSEADQMSSFPLLDVLLVAESCVPVHGDFLGQLASGK